jgi:pimeloyl-ACP methyl ester carboxylesterase
LAKAFKGPPERNPVRTRRAYFDCQFGQLHVRTAFPTTGGFDEGVTLICLHGGEASSRSFVRLLPKIAAVRSVYAPDLPGCGESDPSPAGSIAEAALAVSDFADDLRLRQIDLLGVFSGAAVALSLAARRTELVRRTVLIGLPTADALPTIQQPSLVLRTRAEARDEESRIKNALPNGKLVSVEEYVEGLLEAAPDTLAQTLGGFLAAP